MKHARVKKIELPEVANDNEIEMMEHYRTIAQKAHELCKSVDMDEFEKKYGFNNFA